MVGFYCFIYISFYFSLSWALHFENFIFYCYFILLFDSVNCHRFILSCIYIYFLLFLEILLLRASNFSFWTAFLRISLRSSETANWLAFYFSLFVLHWFLLTSAFCSEFCYLLIFFCCLASLFIASFYLYFLSFLEIVVFLALAVNFWTVFRRNASRFENMQASWFNSSLFISPCFLLSWALMSRFFLVTLLFCLAFLNVRNFEAFFLWYFQFDLLLAFLLIDCSLPFCHVCVKRWLKKAKIHKGSYSSLIINKLYLC